MTAYEMRVSLPDFENMNRERMYDYADGRCGHPDFMDNRGYQQYSRKSQARRGYDYNHGYQRGGNQRPYRYEPANHDLLHRPPESDYYRLHGHDNSHRPPDPDMYHGPPRRDLFDRHPGYDMHNRPPIPDMRTGPPIPDIRNGPPMPDMRNGPPMPDMHNGPTVPDMHNGLPMPDRHNRPPPGYTGHGPTQSDMHNGLQPFHGPQNSDYNHGRCAPDVYNGPQGPDCYHGPPPNMGPHAPDLQFRPHGPDNHHGALGPNVGNGPPNGDMFCRPPGLEIDPNSQGPEAFHPGIPPPGLCNGPPNVDRFPGHGGFDNHLGMQGPNIPDGRHIPPGLEAQQDRNNSNIIIHDMQPKPPHHDIVHNPPSHEFPPGHPHQSPLYPGLHLHPTTPISVPPPTAAYMHVGPVHHIPSVIQYPPVNPSCPPLPQTPPIEQRPPTPPSPCPPSPKPPSPRPPSPRPPSPTSPPPLSPKEAGTIIKREDVYDPVEASFSPASSSESPEMNEKQKESIINKYVKHAQKLKSSGNTIQTVKSADSGKPLKISQDPLESVRPVKIIRDPIESVKPVKIIRDPVEVKHVKISREPAEGIKPVKMSRESRKVECDRTKLLEESPARPSLDARLMLMFGATTSEKETSPIKEKKRSPTKAMREVKGDLKEMSRPLSPPPSPFRSKQKYLYWHKVTLKMRKSSKVTSVDFVSPKVKPIVQKAIPNAGHAKVGQKAMPAASHVQVRQKAMPDAGHAQVGQKAIPNAGHALVEKSSSLMEPLKVPMLPLPKNLPSDFPPVCKRNKLEENVESNSFKAESVAKSVERVHPYKLGSSKGHVIQSSLDSEFELTCEPLPEQASGFRKVVPVDHCGKDPSLFLGKDIDSQQNHFKSEDIEMLDIENSGVRSETISIVLSEIIKELKNEIRKELTSKILDKGINKVIED